MFTIKVGVIVVLVVVFFEHLLMCLVQLDIIAFF